MDWVLQQVTVLQAQSFKSLLKFFEAGYNTCMTLSLRRTLVHI